MLKIDIPEGANKIIKSLQASGYEAYVVGGCVRDSLLGKIPKDWDICTSALPDDVKRCLPYRMIDTGLQHGTVTVVVDDVGYEVTTYRKDGDYSDNRHPDTVEFVTSLTEDLARRDFTINAMAYNDTDGLIDRFGGILDLKRQLITCVGNPDDRFSEDALRILRAMRFAATYGFSIQATTAESIHKNKDRLNNIAAERIQTELTRMLVGDGVLQILLDFSDVIAVIIPELKPCIGFDQNNRYHQYTVYDHIAHAVSNDVSKDMSVRLSLLLHDIGKPQCYSEDEKGGHFHGHAVPSRDLSESVLNRLRFDNKTKSDVLTLVLYHDSCIAPETRVIRRWLNKIGETLLRRLLLVKMADISAHKEGTYKQRLELCFILQSIVNDVISEEQCFKIKDLEVNGNDVLALGVPEGQIVGSVLNHLLTKVINDELQNNREDLLDEAKNYLSEVYYE